MIRRRLLGVLLSVFLVGALLTPLTAVHAQVATPAGEPFKVAFVYVSPVAFPAVKKGMARVRVSVMATHSTSDILQALAAFEKAKTLIGLNKNAP